MHARTIAFGAFALSCLAGAAVAHTSYLLPSAFNTPDAETVTIQAAFADHHYFRPEVAVMTDGFHYYDPAGRRQSVARIAPFEQVTILETPLPAEGTYRFTTGPRLGRASTLFRIDGQWLAPEELVTAPPAGTEQVQAQTETVADVYVTKGEPTDAPLNVMIGRLAIQPLSHPSRLTAAEGFDIRVTFDGEPLANQTVTIDREGGDYETPRFLHREITTDTQGRARLSFDRPGAYLIMTRYRAEAPAGSETPMRSYTTSLTFEVAP